jgi:hypothetical protein
MVYHALCRNVNAFAATPLGQGGAICEAVQLERSQNSALDKYERKLAGNIVLTMRRSIRQEDDAPGPDARQALSLILRALESRRELSG